jgi:DNA-binding GntR family transcriptional regulator
MANAQPQPRRRGPGSSPDSHGEGTLVDEVVDELRTQIVDGTLSPGTKILQQECAEWLGVSRTPLREAFHRLAANGWVSLRPRQGAEVRALTASEAEEIFTLRILLETFVARLGAIGHAEDREPLAAALIGLAAAEQRDAVDDANQRFHELIYGFDGPGLSTALIDEVRRHWARALRYRLVYWARPGAATSSEGSHRAIYEAWSERDAGATEYAVAAHLLQALADITTQIDADYQPSEAIKQLAARYESDVPSAGGKS